MEVSNIDPLSSETENSEKKAHQTSQPTSSKRRKTVRGSGFTYDEDKGRTDQSTPLNESEASDVSKLPDLGKKNRP